MFVQFKGQITWVILSLRGFAAVCNDIVEMFPDEPARFVKIKLTLAVLDGGTQIVDSEALELCDIMLKSPAKEMFKAKTNTKNAKIILLNDLHGI